MSVMDHAPVDADETRSSRRQQPHDEPGPVRRAATDHAADGLYRSSAGGDDQQPPSQRLLILMIAMAGLGGVLFGYDLGVIATALPGVAREFDLSHRQQEVAVGILYAGAGIGAFLGGALCDACGRRCVILWTDLGFLLGAVLLGTAPCYEIVVLGRFVVGVAVATSGIADVSYLHEIAPPSWRGSIVSVNEACIALGFLLAFGVGTLLSMNGDPNAWRLMFYISGYIALLQMLGMSRMPESPMWLDKQVREAEAGMVSGWLYVDQGFSSTLTPSHSPKDQDCYGPILDDAPDRGLSVRHGRQVNDDPALSKVGRVSYGRQLIKLVKQQHAFMVEICMDFKRQTIIAVFLAIAQQLCGQTNVLSYASIIFAAASRNDQSSQEQALATLSIGLVKFLVTVIVVWKIETVGRRVLLLSGMATISVGILVLVIAFETTKFSVVAGQDASESAEIGGGLSWAVVGVLLVVSGYSMSFGTLTWLLTSELFPTEIRGRALGASTILTYITAAVVTSTFITTQEWLGRPSFIFILYLFITCLGFLFALKAIPDTKEKSAAEIEASLDSMLLWKRLSRSLGTTSPLGIQLQHTESMLPLDTKIS